MVLAGKSDPTRAERALAATELAIDEVARLRRTFKRGTSRQVGSLDERQLAKATSLAWFNAHLPEFGGSEESANVATVGELFRELISYSSRATGRAKYDSLLKSIRSALIDLQDSIVSRGLALDGPTIEAPPDFDKLVADPKIRAVLIDRWIECQKCVVADAPLAATVMMGGLLETLLLARIDRASDKASIFRSRCAPISRLTGKTLPLQEWGLRNYIDVAHELAWITQSARDVGEVLRDYRNYVHPYKQISHLVRLTNHDAALFWEITKKIARQLVDSATI